MRVVGVLVVAVMMLCVLCAREGWVQGSECIRVKRQWGRAACLGRL